jgi:hypothetical protein
VKEHPIIFNGDMIRAILDGKKTQTRRVIRPQPKRIFGLFTSDAGRLFIETERIFLNRKAKEMGRIYFPYGAEGSHLWVRETWAMRLDTEADTDKARHYLRYRSDGTNLEMEWHNYGRWRPSIHMPRWASRITLEVTGVKVERVQDITEEDAKAEGVELGRVIGYGRLGMRSYREGFIEVWDEINHKRGYGWSDNPWVWAIEFGRVD